MTTTLTKNTREIETTQANIIDTLRTIVAEVDSMDAGQCKDVHDKMKIAQEFAKLHERATQMQSELTVMHAKILGRIGKLGQENLIGASYRAASRFYATFNDKQLRTFLASHPSATALGAYRNYGTANGSGRAVYNGRRFATHRGDYAGQDQEVAEEIESRHAVARSRAAVVTVLDDYLSANSVPRSAGEIADQIIADYAEEYGDSGLFREGVRQAVMGAISAAPVDVMSDDIPRLITVYNNEEDRWYRVPSEYATVGDFRNMIAKRREHIARLQSIVSDLEQCVPVGAADTDWLRDDSYAKQARADKTDRFRR